MTPTPIQDELALARDRKRVSTEYARASALLHEHPGAHVRAAVLAAAESDSVRRAQEARQRRRWRITSAVAATVVVGTLTGLIGLRVQAPPEPAAVADVGSKLALAPVPARLAIEKDNREKLENGTSGRVERLETQTRQYSAPAPAGVPARAETAAALPVTTQNPQKSTEQSSAADAAVSNSRARMAERSEPTLMNKAAGAAAPVSPPAAAMQDSDPMQWLDRIKQLRMRGLDDEADVQLKKFREQFPKMEIPEAALKPSASPGSPSLGSPY
jgi:hypothetical protein